MKRLPLAVAALLVCAAVARAHDMSTAPVATAMTDAAQKFLASLDADQKAKTVVKFDDPQRLNWHNIPLPERKGLQFREMKPDQRKLCLALLQSGLSEAGHDKVMKIMSLENNLREGEKNRKGPLRDPERYYLTIFGTPDAKAAWGWSFEGHHLSLNFTLDQGTVTSDTPSFWGANPAIIKLFALGGPETGTRTLMQEEQLAFDLVNMLDEAQRKKATIAEKAPNDYRQPGSPHPPQDEPVGLPATEMTEAQRKGLRALLTAYNDNLAAPLSAARMAAIDAAGLEKTHFAWAGAAQPGVGHYYRVQGPTFVLEFVNIQTDPHGNRANHIHSVWRNMGGDFGMSVHRHPHPH